MIAPHRGHIRPYAAEFSWAVRVFDVVIVLAALWASLHATGLMWYPLYNSLAAITVVAFYFFAELLHVYRAWRLERLWLEARQLAMAWMGVTVCLLIVGYVTKSTHMYSRLALGVWFVAVPCLLVGWRAVARRGLSELRKRGYNSRTVAIVGTGEQARRCARALRALPQLGLVVIGFFDDRKAPRSDDDSLSTGAGITGSHGDLVDLARNNEVDVVYVTYPITAADRIRNLIDRLSDTTASVYVVPDSFMTNLVGGHWIYMRDVAAVSVFETPFIGINAVLKRCMDLVVASTALLVFALPMLAVAIGIKLTSRGPVFFRQNRYGLDCREFRIWKFRTMTVDEDGAEIAQATANDPRVTPLGAFLRRTSLDELPQLFNVLIGTMSVVGPRPHALAHNEWYRRHIPAYMVRHKVKPGISGWAQVHGFRGETSRDELMERRVEYDLWYIRNWSLMLDLLILMKTIPVVLSQQNAH